MHHYLEFIDEKSSKFWEIILDGKSFTVVYGKIGTEGQKQKKNFESAEQAEKEALKLLSEKLKKGYIEKGESGVSSLPRVGAVSCKQSDQRVDEKADAEPEKPAANGKISEAFAGIRDKNLKFAIIDELISLKLIKKESTEEIYTRMTGLPFDREDLELNYDYSKVAADYYATFPVTETMLENVTGIFWEGGCELPGIIWPNWDGECDTFSITDLEGVGVLPGLKEIKGNLFKLNDLSPLRSCALLEILDVDSSCEFEDLTPLLDLQFLRKVKLVSVESSAATVDELKRRKIKTNIRLVGNSELYMRKAREFKRANDQVNAAVWYEKVKAAGDRSICDDLAKMHEGTGDYLKASENFIAYLDYRKSSGWTFDIYTALHAAECSLCGGNHETAQRLLADCDLAAALVSPENEYAAYYTIIYNILYMIVHGSGSYDERLGMIDEIINANELLNFSSGGWDFSFIQKLAAGKEIEPGIAGIMDRMNGKKGTWNSCRRCWMHFDVEPSVMGERHWELIDKNAADSLSWMTGLEINLGEKWKVISTLDGFDAEGEEAGTEVKISIASYRAVSVEARHNENLINDREFFEMEIAPPVSISELPSFLGRLEEEFNVTFAYAVADIDIDSDLKGNTKNDAVWKINKWLVEISGYQRVNPKILGKTVPEAFKRKAVHAVWYSRCGEELPDGVDWIRVPSLKEAIAQADPWWEIVKKNYFDYLKKSREAEDLREDGHDLRRSIWDCDELFEKTVDKAAGKAAKKVKLADKNLEYIFQCAFRELYLNEYYDSSVIVRALEVYIAGHYPCGLDADGRIMVY